MAIAENIIKLCQKAVCDIPIIMGIGETVSTIAGSHISYQEALKALEIGSKVAGKNAIMHFSDLGSYGVLNEIDNMQELEHCINSSIGLLVDYDAKTNSNLCNTLEVFLKNNFNLKYTAKELNLHYNSLQYRLNKISEITNLDIGSSEGLFSLMLGLKVRKLFLASLLK